MPFLIETAQKRLHKKLTRKQGNKKEYPWYESSAIRSGAIQVFVTDDEAARNALQATYYGHRLEFVKVESQDKAAAPAPEEEEEEQSSGEAKRAQDVQAPHHLNGKVKGSKPRATNVKAPPPPPTEDLEDPEVDNTQSEEDPEEPESTDNPQPDAA
jgi:hypothetical protein